MALFKPLPAGIILGDTDTQTITNKTIVGTSNTISQTLGSKVKTSTRDLTAATASVAYTGVGFKPRAIIAFGTITSTASDNYTTFNGVCDSALAQSSVFNAGSLSNTFTSTLLTFYDAVGTSFQYAVVSSLDSDGFTLSWTKTGTPTGTATLTFLCLQ